MSISGAIHRRCPSPSTEKQSSQGLLWIDKHIKMSIHNNIITGRTAEDEYARKFQAFVLPWPARPPASGNREVKPHDFGSEVVKKN